ncbi:MAG: tRNA (guanosine(37)-N1)-methyltransferase TrmD [Candidatus Falkowbacteria bacterium]
MQFHILTIFPDILDSYFSKGMLRIAQKNKIIKIKAHDLRKFAVDKHGTVDDKPYGGGPGQILRIEPVYKTLAKIRSQKHETRNKFEIRNSKSKIVLLSARGQKWTQKMAQKMSKLDEIIFICPRYEGHDERIRKFVDEEISIGDYVLTGGELGAAIIIDSITRLLPGVLGQPESLMEESHSTPGYLEYPQYTRPEVFNLNGRNLRVPKVLLSGHHGKIKTWRSSKTSRKNLNKNAPAKF